ncbi:saccharopine dehydrogenase NADP-binding domain-containing protein [bacterium]|nr:saccharopine dehydrogenase NADP-binding domain-containing protein [bacterium]
MRILFLGGAGEMAVAMRRLMAADAGIEHVSIADIDRTRAEAAAREHTKFAPRVVDVTDRAALAGAMREYDAAISFVGPAYRFERLVAQAAIDARKPVVTIADDYDAFLSVYELDGAAREAGVLMLTGFGNSPGLTQALAKAGCNTMDAPRDVDIFWAAGANENVGPANILHVMHLMTGDTLQWRDGREVRVRCGTGTKMARMPEPLGDVPCVYTGHAESVTLPRFIPGLQNVWLRGGCVPRWIFPFVARLARLGLTKTERRRKVLLSIFNPIIPLFASKSDPDISAGRVEVRGTRNGAEASWTALYSGHIAHITSAPCLVAAKMAAAGEFADLPGGVYPPERLLSDPRDFLKRVRALDVQIIEDIKE